jgi:hypothetical protein
MHPVAFDKKENSVCMPILVLFWFSKLAVLKMERME